MKRLILGTAGHIDHGKTTLVKALTGIETDRLTEKNKKLDYFLSGGKSRSHNCTQISHTQTQSVLNPIHPLNIYTYT